jgi:hypothetical protein
VQEAYLVNDRTVEILLDDGREDHREIGMGPASVFAQSAAATEKALLFPGDRGLLQIRNL